MSDRSDVWLNDSVMDARNQVIAHHHVQDLFLTTERLRHSAATAAVSTTAFKHPADPHLRLESTWRYTQHSWPLATFDGL